MDQSSVFHRPDPPAMPPDLSRRDALKSLTGLGAVLTASRALHAAEGTVSPPAPVASASGPLQSTCFWCFKPMPLEDLARAARAMGLASIELLDPPEWEIVRRHGLTCAIANGPTSIADGLNRLENHARFVPAFHARIAEAAAAGIASVICFSGNRNGLADEQGLENCVAGAKQIVGAAEKAGVTVCLELLNSRINHPDYQCDRTAWGVEVVRRVGSERFKLLYDIYHM